MELWKDIPGYEGIYEASNLGNIRTAEGKTTSNARYAKRVWKQRTLKPKSHTNSKGRKDLKVSLWKAGKEKGFLVSRLVAMTWCDGYANEMTVNHIDGNYMNNRADNLEWVSLSDNIKHGFETGLYDAVKIPVRIIDVYGGYIDFTSLAEGSRYLGRNNNYISNCIKNGRKVLYSFDGEPFTYTEIKTRN